MTNLPEVLREAAHFDGYRTTTSDHQSKINLKQSREGQPLRSSKIQKHSRQGQPLRTSKIQKHSITENSRLATHKSQLLNKIITKKRETWLIESSQTG